MRRCTTQSFITVEEVRREKRWTPANEDSRPELVRSHCAQRPVRRRRPRGSVGSDGGFVQISISPIDPGRGSAKFSLSAIR
jgi:hypothetical protein